MTIKRMDNVGIVFADLPAAIAFFTDLGLELEGEADIQGPWADETVGLDGLHCHIAMLRTPDGHGRLELATYLQPDAHPATPPSPPPNTIGFHRVMFLVDDVHATVDHLRRDHGAELLGAIARFADVYELCYVRGPEGVVVGLAQEIGPAHVENADPAPSQG